MHQTFAQPICPRCGQMDMTLKVSAVHAAGTSVSGGLSIIGGYPANAGGLQNNLSARLAPPPEPRMSGYNPLLALLALVVVMPGALMVSCMLGPMLDSGHLEHLQPDQVHLLMWGTASIALGFTIAFSIALSQERKKKRVAREKCTVWPMTMQRWDRLYYCLRDDIVFEPGKGECVPVDQIRAYLGY